MRVRLMRDFVAQLRTAVEINMARVKELHSVEIELSGD